MRYVNGISCGLMILFAIAQYNDPDGLLWTAIYGIPAIWAGVAAFRPELLTSGQARPIALGACVILAIAGSIYMWPQSIADWWDNEEVREGGGLIIATVTLLIVVQTAWRGRQPGSADARSG